MLAFSIAPDRSLTNKRLLRNTRTTASTDAIEVDGICTSRGMERDVVKFPQR